MLIHNAHTYIRKSVYNNMPLHPPITHTLSYMCMHIQIPLGVTLKNENITGNMIEIMEDLQNYVPKKSTKVLFQNKATGESDEYVQEQFHSILLGGDQLTCSRARSSQRARINSDCMSDALLGLVPCCEDWHAKVVFLTVGTKMTEGVL